VRFRRIIRKQVRRSVDGGNVAADVNAVIAGNVGEGRAHTRVSSKQRIVQRTENREDDDPNARR